MTATKPRTFSSDGASPHIQAVFWDCGGVFLTNGWDHGERTSVVEHFGLNDEEFERRHPEANDAWERGKITIDEYLRRTVFYEPRAFSPEEFIARMRGVSKVLYPEMIEFLRRLRAKRTSGTDLTIYLLSNESRELMTYRIPTFGLTGLFDAYLVSAYIGLRKPEAAFYRCALDVAQRSADECVFVDDREDNLEGAVQLGIRGVRMTDPVKTIAELEALGLMA